MTEKQAASNSRKTETTPAKGAPHCGDSFDVIERFAELRRKALLLRSQCHDLGLAHAEGMAHDIAEELEDAPFLVRRDLASPMG